MKLRAMTFSVWVLAGCGVGVEAPYKGRPCTGAVPQEPHTRAVAPFISRFSPHRGVAGTEVRMVGSGFAAELSDNNLTFGGVEATLLEGNDGYLAFVVPEGAVTGDLLLQVGDAAPVVAGPFEVLSAPVLHDVSPREVMAGAADSVVQLRGEGFLPGATVRFDREAIPTNYRNDTTLDVVLEASRLFFGSEHTLSVDGAPQSLVFSVANPGPALLASSPSAVDLSTRCPTLRLMGSGFAPDSRLLVDGVEHWSSFIGPTELSVSASDFSAGEHTLQVVSPQPGGGTSAPLVVHAR